jgi:hypothetical protein
MISTLAPSVFSRLKLSGKNNSSGDCYLLGFNGMQFIESEP